jgi:hypothetical protein
MAENVNAEEKQIQNWNRLEAIQNEALQDFKGLFPSTRFHPWFYERKDNSAYFTATLLHSLSRLYQFLSQAEKQKLETIRQKAYQGVAPFQNKQGLPRYNFWKTHPSDHFPNGWLLGHWERFRPPDDVDDSVMTYMMQNRNREEATWLMQHIDSYANGKKKWILNTPPEYRKLGAWCTFFCKDMPLGFDACVVSNVLYFNHFYQQDKNGVYLASLEYLCKMLDQKDHIYRPEKISPYYPHSSIILYHLAKLMSQFYIGSLEKYRDLLLENVQYELENTENQTEKTMLENAWMWLSGTIPSFSSKALKTSPFYFFVLPLTLEYEGWFFQFLAHKRWSHLRFRCEALEIAFSIENQTLRKICKENLWVKYQEGQAVS